MITEQRKKTASTFSDQLESWLRSKDKKTLARLGEVFGERAFGIAFLLLLIIPALPIPTGGITHIFELIAMLLSLEMLVGRRTLWFPRKLAKKRLSQATINKALPFLLKRVRWFEKFSRPRLQILMSQRLFRSLIALLMLMSSLFSFIAPPFSGLDTLPALGGVVMALALILNDFAFLVTGMLIMSIGAGLVIGLGVGGFHLLHTIFH